MTEKRHMIRVALVTVAVASVMAGLGVRLVFLHLGEHEEARANILEQRKITQTIPVGRGRILDRSGDVVAMDLTVKHVIADPKRILADGYIRFIGYQLARVLNLEPAMVFSKLNRPGREYEAIKKAASSQEIEQVKEMDLPGVYFDEESRRYYPHDSLMCHVIGFSNMEGVGSAGVEQRYDTHLCGTPGLRLSEKDAHKRELYGRRSLEIPAREGSDVYLTLDMRIQYMVENELDKAMEEHSARAALAIVQRVRTGEILALASRPDFDLNEYGRITDDKPKRNRPIADVYEPGSTFKVAVIAAALNEGLVHSDEIIDCENGCWYTRGRPLRDYHPHGLLSVADVLKKSSNIGAAKIAIRLGEKRLEEYLRNLGVGQKLGIDLPGEERGLLSPHQNWAKPDITRIAMGHSVSVTALQMLNIVSSIANDGFLMKPFIVSHVIDTEGRIVYQAEPEVLARPIRHDTAATMRKLLARVTEQGGTGRRAALDDYTVGGKTGTAQKPIPGGYSDKDNFASFVGFLPVEDPEISIIVVVDSPQPLHTGGSVSAPVFRRIAEQVMRYMASRPNEWHGPFVQMTNLQRTNEGETR